jgi:hypothetical protein
VVVDSGCKHVLISSEFHKNTVQGNPKLQNSNITLSGASNEEISVPGDTYTTWEMDNISICRSKKISDHQTYMVTENSTEEKVQKIWKIRANKWKVPTTVAQGLAADVILGASAFKALGVIINGIDETLTICGKTMHLNKDIFLYGDVTLKPGETETILGNTNEKDGGISITNKIVDPKIAITRRAKAKQGNCKIKIYNISDQEIEIPKDTIIARIEERNYPKLEISIKGSTQKWNNITVTADDDFSLKDVSVNGNINKDSIPKLIQYLISDKDIFREKLRKGDKYTGKPANSKKGSSTKTGKDVSSTTTGS